MELKPELNKRNCPLVRTLYKMLYKRITSNTGQEPESSGLSLFLAVVVGTLGTIPILSVHLQFDRAAVDLSFFQALENLWQNITSNV